MKDESKKRSLARRIASIFWNFDQRRLRAVWRILSVLLCTVILTVLIGAPFAATGGGGTASIIEKYALYIAAIMSILLAIRFLDKRQFSDTGIFLKKNWWIDLGFGLLLGALLMTLIFLVEYTAGWITISETLYRENSGQPFLAAFIQPVLLALVVGVAEELMFRGYLLLNLAEGFNLHRVGPRWALVSAWLLTSAVFGFAHIITPNATLISSVNITLIGIWLGLGYVLTGSLAIPIGIHITWNLFQGSVFGFPVSGGRDFSTTFILIEQGGPELWTGGAFGPEAGLLGLIALGVGVLLTLAWVRSRYQELSLFTAIAKYASNQKTEMMELENEKVAV
jgi:membrane protease YdiL (CAAX protease family)